jgi:FKBP-type peptidyl-prolyl cis-trans isomerase
MKSLKTQEWIAVGVAVVAVIFLFFGGNLWAFFFGAPAGEPGANGQLSNTSTSQQAMTNISEIPGLEIYDESLGTGTEAVAGKKVTAHYIGTLSTGVKFDSSLDRGTPFTFALGDGQVIKGWDLGIAGMKVGGIRKLVISPELGYGSQALGPIPANSTLIFEVELLEVK